MPQIISNPLHQKLLLATAAIGMFLDGLDGSIVNIILPQISGSFDIDTGTVSWVIITYLLMVAGLILIFGKSAERGSLKTIFLLGLFIFTIGSAACGLSPDFQTLLGSRILQGVGAAMIAATASLLCVTYLPRNMLGFSLGVISMAISIGVAVGPAIGGFLAQYLSWHWAFLINIPIGLLILPFALYVIPKDVPGIKERFDRFGAIMLFSMMALGVYVLERIPHMGMFDHQIQICTILCIGCIIVFIIRELTCQNPLINISIFTGWEFTATFIAFLIMSCV
ncbi:MAG: MFS transporter, partial [Methanospirillum sp.]|uniref:MFS transporter n=1 Tax=Methanospirillum sp. TaxID=45200 RepID=UPI00236FF335